MDRAYDDYAQASAFNQNALSSEDALNAFQLAAANTQNQYSALQFYNKPASQTATFEIGMLFRRWFRSVLQSRDMQYTETKGWFGSQFTVEGSCARIAILKADMRRAFGEGDEQLN